MRKVAIQGYEGSFHQIVAMRYFGADTQTVACATFKEVARQVERGMVDFGVMAIENSIAGSIISNYNILQNTNLQVAGEAYLPICQNLLVLPGVKLEEIEEVHSHYMALQQCEEYLDGKPWRLVESEDTALSARIIADERISNRAAIGSSLAAELFGLEIAVPEINTIKNNYTRFMILKRYDHTIIPDADKASLYFKARHERGALLDVLRQMEDYAVNLTKLQSYPIPSEPWHYLFHVDMEFDTLYDYVKILDRLQEHAETVHVYGVYKRGEELKS